MFPSAENPTQVQNVLLMTLNPDPKSHRNKRITGLVERFDWDGKRAWSFVHAETKKILHHDIEVLPNGNLMPGCNLNARCSDALALSRSPNWQM